MKHLPVLTLALSCLFATTSLGSDYLLRLDTIGYVDVPISVAKPNETVHYSVEVVARPSSGFYGKVIVGKHTLRLRGKLQPIEGGNVKVEVEYTHSIDTGNSIPTQTGRMIPTPEETTVYTRVTVALGQPIAVGGWESKTAGRSSEQNKKSKARFVLVVDKHDSALDRHRYPLARRPRQGGESN